MSQMASDPLKQLDTVDFSAKGVNSAFAGNYLHAVRHLVHQWVFTVLLDVKLNQNYKLTVALQRCGPNHICI